MRGIINEWKTAGDMKQHKLDYCKNLNGRIETFIGDKLSGPVKQAYTISLNYAKILIGVR